MDAPSSFECDYRRHQFTRQHSSLRKPGSRSLRKSVSFDENPPATKAIEHVRTIPKKEIKQRWLTPKEFQKTRQDAITALHCESNTIDIRGLERHTEMGICQYQENYRDAVMAVLRNQEMVWYSNSWTESSDQLIAKAYRAETAVPQREAARIARLDAQEVREYLADCTLESIRQEQQKSKQQKKTFVERALMGPAQKLTRSLSFKSVMNPQA